MLKCAGTRVEAREIAEALQRVDDGDAKRRKTGTTAESEPPRDDSEGKAAITPEKVDDVVNVEALVETR